MAMRGFLIPMRGKQAQRLRRKKVQPFSLPASCPVLTLERTRGRIRLLDWGIVYAERFLQAKEGKMGDEGPVFTTGESFRACAEAVQRSFRAQVLNSGFGKYGHVLDQRGVEQGLNFVHPLALETAKRRADAGKGVDRQRTFGNMLSSQALCFNILVLPAKAWDYS